MTRWVTGRRPEDDRDPHRPCGESRSGGGESHPEGGGARTQRAGGVPGLPGHYPLTWHGQELHLLGDGALHWPSRGTLLVADLHLGKEAVFRARGLPIPDGAGQETLNRLERTRTRHLATNVVILGDLVHGPEGWTPETVTAIRNWRTRVPGTVWWIRGNHDRAAGASPHPLGLEEVEEGVVWSGLELRHTPPHDGLESPPVICGHLHPVIRLQASGSRGRLPCFVVDPQVLVLPAYGVFTGGHPVERRPERRLLVAAQEAVVEVARTRTGRGSGHRR